MKFSFPTNELNAWTGKITERLVRVYFEKELIPMFKEKDGWTDVFFASIICPINPIEKELIKGNTAVLDEMDEIRRLDYVNSRKNIISEINKNFLCRGIFPTSKLLDSCLKLLLILGVATDGIFFKTKRTDDTITKGKALSKINKNYETGLPINYVDEEELPQQIPLVNGEIEIIEVKSGNACIPYHQIEDYQRAIENGFYLRYFHVGIITFRGNSFEIKEKLITNPREVTKYPLGKS